MPRVRPRLRLFLVLLGLVALLGLSALGLELILENSDSPSVAIRTAPPPPVPVRRVRQALRSQPSLPLDAEHTDVLLAIACTLRRDRVEAYGGPRPTTPFLSLLAKRGVLFEHAITQSSWTRPSTGSLLTGRFTRALQLDDPGDKSFHNRALGDEFVTIAESLADAGYRTIGASGNPNISSTFGFDQGFDVHHEPEHLWREARGHPLTGAELNAQLLAELDDISTDQRVFLQPFYVDTHAPRRPARKAVRAVNVRDVNSTRRVLNYDAALYTLDAHLAQLYLEVQQRRPNLLLVVIGDHGEGLDLPVHHGRGHGNQLYTTTTDVPFLWFHPSLPEPGHRVDGLAMGVDLLPTLLDLLDIALNAQVDGTSQAAAVLGQAGRASHTLAYTETMFRRADKAAVFGQGYQLVRDHEQPETADRLYAMDESLQTNDVSGNHPRIAELLGKELDAWLEEQQLAAEGQGAPSEGSPSELMTEQLRTLGYIE